MIRIHPDYYEHFSCTADQCPITCCQEWKISVDDHTNRCWKKLTPPAETLKQKKNLSAYTAFRDGTRIIALDENHQCPFLSETKLCRLVLEHGDHILSETCQTFPREIHRFSSHEEETLMPCCPAVIDLWNEAASITFPQMSELMQSETASFLFQIRSTLIHLMQNPDRTPEEALMEGFYLLSKLDRAKNLSPELFNDVCSEDTLAKLHEAVHSTELPLLDTIEESNEILQDLAVNYQKEGLYQSYLNPVLDAAEKLTAEYGLEHLCTQWTEFQNTLQKFQPLLRSFLANELFSDLLMPDGDLENMMVQMQWLALKYAAIRQCLFLNWRKQEDFGLSYKTVRDYIVILTRMTGYDEEDIYEYLENSFESLIWEWGYFAMILA